MASKYKIGKPFLIDNIGLLGVLKPYALRLKEYNNSPSIDI